MMAAFLKTKKCIKIKDLLKSVLAATENKLIKYVNTNNNIFYKEIVRYDTIHKLH